ncbi:transcriptional regulator SlyA, partial [Cronobacter muytjensii]
RGEILSGITQEEHDQMLRIVARLEKNILALSAKE